MIHAVLRKPLPDTAKLVFYRRDFYGAPAGAFTHALLHLPHRAVEATIHAQGLERRFYRTSGPWQVVVYARTSSAERH